MGKVSGGGHRKADIMMTELASVLHVFDLMKVKILHRQ